MVSQKSIAAQLKKIGFNQHAWGRAEVKELPNIILPDEEIFECVNGTYEGGFALLVATDVRVLLIDKKPFNYLTVEDLRFDMINEIDYNHRALGAYVNISTGNRDLKFRSYNQPRLRELINHVQHRMAESKKTLANTQAGQHQHLEQINERLQTYLMAQYQHQQELQKSLQEAQKSGAEVISPEPPKPSPELSDYLLAQGLLAEYKAKTGMTPDALQPLATPPVREQLSVAATPESTPPDLYAEGVKEVFGDRTAATPDPVVPPAGVKGSQGQGRVHPHLHGHLSFDINPLRIAYSKLPMALRNRKFGRPSLHAHSQAAEPVIQPQPT